MFERFYKKDQSRSRATEGSGLGLAIAKSIVELQGGSIRAEYEDGVIQFIVSLPIIENNKRIEWYMIKGLFLKEISPFIF